MIPEPRLGERLAYGAGGLAEGFKSASFEIFLLFYYNQVLGLSGTLSGLALMIALVCDAVSDPLVGSLSDSTRSRFGRRHPWMVASVLPLSVCFFALFSPPAGLSQLQLFAWLTAGTIGVRTALTFFQVPHTSLAAEMSDDYARRTRIVGYRVAFGMAGLAITPLVGFFVFFRTTPGLDHGLKNAGAYASYGLTFALALAAAVTLSTAGTWRRIPLLRDGGDHPAFSPMRPVRELRAALRGRSFRMLFTGVLIFFAVRGIQNTLGLHLTTHFWELPAEANGTLQVASLLGMLLGLAFWGRLSDRVEKRSAILVGTALFSFFVFLSPALRLLGLFPPNEEQLWIQALLGACLFVATFGAAGSLTAANSAMADLTDEHELRTGLRQEGIYFAALSFSAKCASGIGHAVAGWGLDAIAFPSGAIVGTVDPDIVRMLGVVYGPVVLGPALVGLFFMSRYRLDRARYLEIRRALEQRRAALARAPG